MAAITTVVTNIPKDDKSNIIDHLIGIDDIGRPKEIDMTIIESGVMNSAVLMIIRLLLTRKGTYADIPDLGIDIRGRYRFAFEEELTSLENEIQQQMQTYLPEFSPVEVHALMRTGETDGPKVVIEITIDSTIYKLIYNVTTNTIEGMANS